MRFSLLAAILPLGVALAPAGAQAPDPAAAPLLTADHRAALRCAAVFAIVATEQRNGVREALAFPPLAFRGKRYFAQTAMDVMAQANISREAVRDLMTAEAAALQKTATADPAAMPQAQMAACLPRLDRAVPPLATPNLGQCAAIFAMAYDEVHAREGLSPAARDLATLASVLASRQREALVAAGSTGDDADRRLAEARDAMRVEASDGEGGVDKYDIARCYDLARPDEKSHY